MSAKDAFATTIYCVIRGERVEDVLPLRRARALESLGVHFGERPWKVVFDGELHRMPKGQIVKRVFRIIGKAGA